MKSRLKITSILLLFAMVLSAFPALTLPSRASAAVCYQAQFVADVTVPDGTRYNPDTAFKKTWRLRNIGTCSWSSTDVSMIFDSGSQMGAPASVALPSTVAPGATVDISVDMKAPSTAGRYIGYWKLKSAQGTIFGIGVSANKAWWVEINVVGGTTDGVVYDFVVNAPNATWSSGAGGLTFPGTDGDAKGFALKRDKPKFESGVEATQPGLLFAPQNITNGFIQARYPGFTVQSGDRFRTTVGCESGATTCYVAYRLDYEVSGLIKTYWTFRERFEGLTYSANIDLSPLAGKEVKFILFISAYGSPAGDRALWGNPVIVRKGVIITPTVTGTPPTPTSTATPGTITPTVPPSSCDKVQFIADVNIKDGTVLQPGAQFTKTWRLKNIGSCAWSTSYQLVFFSGEKMNGPSSATFPKAVAVGETVDISVNLTAPSAAGSYRGYWMFKNASGALFGLGTQGNKPWWVDIKVSGPTVTPGGPTVTPSATATSGGPTATPVAGTVYDFATNVCNATWVSGAGNLPCPGTDGDARGFVLKLTYPRLESGAIDTRPGILTFPQNSQNGYIQGFYPPFKVQSGDRFRSTINCEGGATNCYAAFRLDYQTGSDPIKVFWGPFLERYEGKFYNVDVDLTPLAGKDVKFILTVLASGTATGDRALWVGPYIFRSGGSSALPDLTVTQLKVELPNPSCLSPGDAFGLRAWITNGGQSAAGNFAVKMGDAQQTVNGLAIGETKTVFFTGYNNPNNNPVTVTADAGGAIVESNEQNNSRTETLALQTPTPPAPCASPTATSTPTPTATTTSATVYQNAKYNFKFTLPTGAAIQSQSDSVGRVNLPFASGTNLSEKYIQVNVIENADPCVSPVMDGGSASTVDVTFNSIQFTKQTGQGVAAGNIYDWVAYSTLSNSACISLTFVLHSVNPGVFTTPPPEFDKNAESAVFETTMSTFNWINP